MIKEEALIDVQIEFLKSITLTETNQIELIQQALEKGFKAALEWAATGQEPVGWVFDWDNGIIEISDHLTKSEEQIKHPSSKNVRKVYEHAAPRVVPEKLIPTDIVRIFNKSILRTVTHFPELSRPQDTLDFVFAQNLEKEIRKQFGVRDE